MSREKIHVLAQLLNFLIPQMNFVLFCAEEPGESWNVRMLQQFPFQPALPHAKNKHKNFLIFIKFIFLKDFSLLCFCFLPPPSLFPFCFFIVFLMFLFLIVFILRVLANCFVGLKEIAHPHQSYDD